jgi:hypothetical protein
LRVAPRLARPGAPGAFSTPRPGHPTPPGWPGWPGATLCRKHARRATRVDPTLCRKHARPGARPDPRVCRKHATRPPRPGLALDPPPGQATRGDREASGPVTGLADPSSSEFASAFSSLAAYLQLGARRSAGCMPDRLALDAEHLGGPRFGKAERFRALDSGSGGDFPAGAPPNPPQFSLSPAKPPGKIYLARLRVLPGGPHWVNPGEAGFRRPRGR